MARKCENCDIMEKYKYWNELPATKHSFFKVMPDDFDRQLLIPKKFSECFKEKLCGWCILVGPSGKKWRVRVSTAKQNSGRVMFSNDGWPSFVRDHGIQLRDFVTFHYTGSSCFKVCIFDASGCEREESYFAKTGYKSQSKSSNDFHIEENLGNSAEEISRNSRGKKKRSVSFDEYDEDDSMSEDYQDETDGESFGFGSGCETNKSVFNQSGRLSSSSLSKSTRAKLSQMYYESNRRTVEEVEMQMAIQKAEKHKRRTKFPLILLIMKPTYVYRGFNFTIPKKWAMQHMLRKPHEIELRVPKKRESWMVGCRWTRSQQCQLRKNWPQFVLENNLEEHDVCVFELISKDEVESKAMIVVHIYRVVDDVVPLTVSRRMV